MAVHIIARKAPGFDPDTRGTIVDGLERVGSSDQGPLTVIVTEAGDFLAIPSKHIEVIDSSDSPDAAAYREEWAVKSGRNPRDVYVPEALH